MAALATVNRYKKSTFALYRMRRAIFDYDDTPKEAQAERVLAYLKERKMRGVRAERNAASRGPYSGLSRRELRMTGTCETDWY